MSLPPSSLHAIYVAFAAMILWQAVGLIHSPTCAYCGKRREHARDCPQRKHDE